MSDRNAIVLIRLVLTWRRAQIPERDYRIIMGFILAAGARLGILTALLHE